MNFSTVLLFSAIAISSCNNSGDKKPAEDTTTTTTTTTVTTQETTPPVEVAKDIVDIAAGSADHSTLVAAVKAAGLVETLKGAGPFTVFAPTNAAFNALPAGTVDNLLKPENKADLTNVLTYHVVAGTLKAADLTNGQKLKTVQGTDLTVSIKDGKVMINGANVTAADLMASNGVIHVIDAVVLPKK
ncbi:MAG: fasciclin domain-containing protein [Chitinophagaceae bacterium]|nr:fasciclin domain-containing protein [Chitinophagaceae bacterium]